MTEVTLPPHPNEEPQIIDFFGGINRTEKWYFPGQTTQYIEFSIMNEGMRKKFQQKTSRDVKISRKDQSAAVGFDPAGDRQELLLTTIVDWYIIDTQKGVPVPFSNNGPGGILAQWINRADPRMIDKLELAIREANPWMQDEMDSASIREEITRLEKLEAEAIDRERQKANF